VGRDERQSLADAKPEKRYGSALAFGLASLMDVFLVNNLRYINGLSEPMLKVSW